MANCFIVDDSPVFRGTMRELLAKMGHKVCGEAGDADEFFDYLPKTHPELILLDILMPGKSGLEIMRKLLQMRPNMRVLVVTAVNQEAINEEARAMGAHGILYKPFEPSELEYAINRAMGLPQK